MNFAVIEDHPIVLKSILDGLKLEYGLANSKGFQSMELADRYFIQHEFPEVLISDLKIIDKINFNFLVKMHEKNVRLVIYSGVLNRSFLEELTKLNPIGIVSKNEGLDALKRAIDAVKMGDSYKCPTVDRAMESIEYYRNSDGCPDLLDIEMKVLGLLLQGKDNEAISEELFCSFHTVRAHRRNMLVRNKCSFATLIRRFLLWQETF